MAVTQAYHEAVTLGQSSASTVMLNVPQQNIVSIEHPCVVQNFDKGIKSLGGEAQIKHVLDHRVGDSMIKVSEKTRVFPEPVIGVSLQPDDPLAKKLSSKGVETRNVLVRVTLPKWTGRKRKRGSDDAFSPTAPPPRDRPDSIKAPDLLRRLRDNEGVYTTDPLGIIKETHRFRSPPDFQMHSTNMAVMQELKNHVFRPKYDVLKDFHVDVKHGTRGEVDFPLPPNFSTTNQPYQYEYKQARDVMLRMDEQGNPLTENIHTAFRRTLEPQAPDVEEVPQGPPPDLKLSGKQDKRVLRAIDDLNEMLDKRPLVTKRVIGNELMHYSESVLREATQWVGYLFSAGPWRDVLVRFGIDPRKDPAYRFYQTLMFQLDKETLRLPNRPSAYRSLASRKTTGKSHVFDGKHMPSDVKTFQVCDITDPVIHDLLQTEDIPTECDIHLSGWYHTGTLSKARVILRDKARCLLTGEPPTETDYAEVATLPDNVMDDAALVRFNQFSHSARVVELATEYRGMARSNKKMSKLKGLSRESMQLTKKAARVVGGDAPVLEAEGDGDGEAGVEDAAEDGVEAEMEDADAIIDNGLADSEPPLGEEEKEDG